MPSLPRMDWVSASLDGAILDKASAKTRAEHSEPGLRRAPCWQGSSRPLASLSLCLKLSIWISLLGNIELLCINLPQRPCEATFLPTLVPVSLPPTFEWEEQQIHAVAEVSSAVYDKDYQRTGGIWREKCRNNLVFGWWPMSARNKWLIYGRITILHAISLHF